MSAEDDELRSLFAAEAADALGQLGELALALEQPGEHEEQVAMMFRAAHSLKGSSRLVGLGGIGEVAHALEDVLSRLRAGTLGTSPELVTLVLRGTDILRELLPGELAGRDQAAEVAAAVAELTAATEALGTDRPLRDDPPPQDDPTPRDDPTLEAVAPVDPTPTLTETVKVPADRLEAIGRLVGEALAAQLGLMRLVSERADEDPVVTSLHGLERILDSLDHEARRARMVSFRDIAGPLQRAARDVAQGSGKAIEWEIDGGETQLDRHVLERLRDPLLHLVRNAVDHGLEGPDERAAAGKAPAGRVSVQASTRGDEVLVSVADDGRGVDRAAVADAAARAGVSADAEDAIFSPGLSTAREVTDVSGRGVGLNVVQDSVERLRGQVSVSSEPGSGTRFELRVPLSLASLRCLIIGVGAERYALPLAACASIVDDAAEHVTLVEGQRALALGGRLLGLHDVGELLGSGDVPAHGPVVIVRQAGRTHALQVDRLEGQRDIVVKELSRHAEPLPAIAGAAVEPDGTVTLVLDAAGLLELAAGARPVTRSGAPTAGPAPEPVAGPGAAEGGPTREVLVVDDALTVRELQRSILRRAGYSVRTAVDGQDAFSMLGEARPDLVISDVEMPRMDGFALTESIRAHPALANLPVILITSLGDDAHRRRGLEAGADAYLVKDGFDEGRLLDAIDQILGDR